MKIEIRKGPERMKTRKKQAFEMARGDEQQRKAGRRSQGLSEYVGLHFTQDQLAELEALAEERGWSRSMTIRVAALEGMKRLKKKGM